VDEATWLACTYPGLMLKFVRRTHPHRIRKLRLFAVACCRRLLHRIRNRPQRELLDLVEGYADGRVAERDLSKALNCAANYGGASRLGVAACFTAHRKIDPVRVAQEAAREAGSVTHRSPHSRPWQDARNAEQAAQAALLRDVLGNPFRRAPAIDPAWLTWREGLIVSMAGRMYEARDFADLPVLADALEEAGCADAQVLGHLRSPGPHVRGCHVIDALLGLS
jgi:hypothetical protein